MVLNATFNNISAITWWLVLLVEETGVPRENHRPATSHKEQQSTIICFFNVTDKLDYIAIIEILNENNNFF